MHLHTHSKYVHLFVLVPTCAAYTRCMRNVDRNITALA